MFMTGLAYSAETGAVTAGLEPVDLTMFFVTPNQQSTLRWQAKTPGAAGQVPYVISDYSGQKLKEGKTKLEPCSTVTVNHVFPRGYFEISFPQAGQTFGIVALEPYAGPADPFFCMDSALSWLEKHPEKRAALVKILKRCGVAMSRERLSLGAVNPDKGRWNWEGDNNRATESMRNI